MGEGVYAYLFFKGERVDVCSCLPGEAPVLPGVRRSAVVGVGLEDRDENGGVIEVRFISPDLSNVGGSG